MRKIGACYCNCGVCRGYFRRRRRRGFRFAYRAVPYRRAVSTSAHSPSPSLHAGQSGRPAPQPEQPGQGATLGAALSEPRFAGDFPKYLLAGHIRRRGRSVIERYSRPRLQERRRAKIRRLCQPSVDANAIVGRIRDEVAPTADQSSSLQKLGGALGAASGYLAKSCPSEIPAQPVARLQLMESQIEELTMATRYRSPAAAGFRAIAERRSESAIRGRACDAPPAADRQDRDRRHRAVLRRIADGDRLVDRSDRQIGAADRGAAAGIGRCQSRPSPRRRTISQAHCPTTVPPTALGALGSRSRRGSTRHGARCCRSRSRSRISKPS